MYIFLYYSGKKVIPITGKVSLIKVSLKNYFYQTIKDSYIQQIKTTSQSISFRGTFFRFIWNGFNFLNGISNGQIIFSETKDQIVIKYRIFFLEAFIIAVVFSVFPFLAAFNKVLSIAITFIIWVIYYIGGNIISIIRFNTFIKESIDKFVQE